MNQINCKKIAEEIIQRLRLLPKPEKFLAAVLVGSTISSQVAQSLNFLKQKTKVAQELGVDFRIYNFPEEIKNDDLREEINKISNLKKVGGVIIQLPLPEHLNKHYALNAIPREKDVDVLGERALGAFYNGRNPVLPPSVGVVEEILEKSKIQMSNVKIAIVGLGFLIGKPIATWLMGKCPEIFLLDKGSDLSILKQADLVISGVGKAGLIKPEMLKKDAVLIDFGYDIIDGKILGDFDSTSFSVSQFPNFYTPTPGGTGPILVAKLFENFYKLNSN